MRFTQKLPLLGLPQSIGKVKQIYKTKKKKFKLKFIDSGNSKTSSEKGMRKTAFRSW